MSTLSPSVVSFVEVVGHISRRTRELHEFLSSAAFIDRPPPTGSITPIIEKMRRDSLSIAQSQWHRVGRPLRETIKMALDSPPMTWPKMYAFQFEDSDVFDNPLYAAQRFIENIAIQRAYVSHVLEALWELPGIRQKILLTGVGLAIDLQTASRLAGSLSRALLDVFNDLPTIQQSNADRIDVELIVGRKAIRVNGHVIYVRPSAIRLLKIVGRQIKGAGMRSKEMIPYVGKTTNDVAKAAENLRNKCGVVEGRRIEECGKGPDSVRWLNELVVLHGFD